MVHLLTNHAHIRSHDGARKYSPIALLGHSSSYTESRWARPLRVAGLD